VKPPSGPAQYARQGDSARKSSRNSKCSSRALSEHGAACFDVMEVVGRCMSVCQPQQNKQRHHALLQQAARKRKPSAHACATTTRAKLAPAGGAQLIISPGSCSHSAMSWIASQGQKHRGQHTDHTVNKYRLGMMVQCATNIQSPHHFAQLALSRSSLCMQHRLRPRHRGHPLPYLVHCYMYMVYSIPSSHHQTLGLRFLRRGVPSISSAEVEVWFQLGSRGCWLGR